MIGSCIESVGVKLPVMKVSSHAITKQMKLIPEIKLELISGIKERRFCSGNEDAFSLAIGAANDCLSYSSYEGENIEMIIFCGISKLSNNLKCYYEPAISNTIKQEIRADKALSFDISNACAGMATGIHIADNYIKTGIIKNCMVVSGEFISLICKNAIKNIVSSTSTELASLTVGDAGAAVILEKTTIDNGFEVLNLQTFSRYSKLCIAKLSNKSPGGEMFTQMQKLHKVSIEDSPKFIEQNLEEAGLTYNDIDYLIPHQTAKRAISSGSARYKEYFGYEPKEIITNLELLGNTASTTHFLALYSMLKKQKFKENDRIMLLSFASGLVMGIIVFKPKGLIKKYGK